MHSVSINARLQNFLYFTHVSRFMPKKDRRIIRASLNKQEEQEYIRLQWRLGLSNDSQTLKDAVGIAHAYLDWIEKNVPQSVFERYVVKLKYL